MEQNKIDNNKNNVPQKQNNDLFFIFIIILIIGFILFFYIDKQESEKRNNLLVYDSYDTNSEELYNNDEAYRGINIFDVGNIYLDGKGLLTVDIYNGKTKKSIHPNEIKQVSYGVTWVGETKEMGLLKKYTLYVVGEKYDAIIALKNYEIK